VPLDALLAHPDVVRLARALSEHPGRALPVEGAQRLAAIALVLRPGREGHPELLMIKRAEMEGDPWSGHVACPGGRMEPRDRDLEATAIRETWEETGIDLSRDGRLLGVLDDISPRTPSLPSIIIRPFVAAVHPSVEIVQSNEVAEAFWVPIDALRNRGAWGTSHVSIRGVGEREEQVFRHDEYLVWGLTHRVLVQLTSYLEETRETDGAV
jgi:8-oxo-dGTP pyrophosphatase MutT (NUDIX family)